MNDSGACWEGRALWRHMLGNNDLDVDFTLPNFPIGCLSSDIPDGWRMYQWLIDKGYCPNIPLSGRISSGDPEQYHTLKGMSDMIHSKYPITGLHIDGLTAANVLVTRSVIANSSIYSLAVRDSRIERSIFKGLYISRICSLFGCVVKNCVFINSTVGLHWDEDTIIRGCVFLNCDFVNNSKRRLEADNIVYTGVISYRDAHTMIEDTIGEKIKSIPV